MITFQDIILTLQRYWADRGCVVMRRLGCIVIKTNRRAIEETAQEILRYYKTSFDEGNAR